MPRKGLHLLLAGLMTVTIGLGRARLAQADGGVVIPDSELWALIEEGQQVAVIRLDEGDAAHVDLFITLVDRSGRSHEVVFFVPLGGEASNFSVVEQTSLEFDLELTEHLDQQLREYASRADSYKSSVRSSLVLGTLVTNGLWTGLLLIPILVAGSCSAPAPIATFQTESSVISIYDVDEQTDVQALIETTGLDPSVSETLAGLQGQQIAVINLQTQPTNETDDWLTASEREGQPGIHLTWNTSLVRQSEEASYAYPLGTGKAWASPIELTRVYVVAEPGIDFAVTSPRLGADLSGMAGASPFGGLAGRIYWRIDEARSPAFASDNAYGSYGRIWRGTYIKSNSDRDIVITKLASVTEETSSAIRRSRFQNAVLDLTWLISLAAGAVIWVTSWWVVMSRMMKASYRWRSGRLWGDAFIWLMIYPGATLAMLLVVGLVAFGVALLLFSVLQIPGLFPFGNEFGAIVLWVLISLPVLIAITGVINAFLFARFRASHFNVSRSRAFGAYLLVVVAANLVYLAFAVSYGGLVGAI